jgi:GT2 family glycosyltransferase/spore maturation protein CgeB
MKILNVAPEANKSGHYGFHNIRDTFLRLGCEIIDFDFIDEEKRLGKQGMNQRLKQLVDTERPDLFYHAIVTDELDKAVLDYIANQTETTSLVLFSDDDWRLAHSLEWVGHYNFAITTVREALPEYTRRGYHHVIFSQWGSNPHVYRPLELEKKYDVTFVGQAYAGRPELINFLRARGVNVRVWGMGWEHVKELRPIAGGFLPTFKVVELFSQSKIVLGMAWTSRGMQPQIKGRTFEYAASRAFQLTNYDARLKEYFEEGKEIVFYKHPEELLEKINYYLEHAEEREQIARNAYERALRDHTWTQRFQHIFGSMAERRPAGKKSITVPTQDRPPVTATEAAGKIEKAGRPLVSVLTYVHNMAEFLDELILSVLKQTYTNFEYVILDDGSTDNTREVISKYLHDKRLRYVYQESTGQGGRFIHLLINKSLSLAQGELICIIGGDDVFMPSRLERHVAEFLKDPELDIAFSEAEIIDATGRVTSATGFGIAVHTFNRWNLARILIKHNIVPHPTVMMRRSCFDKVGLFEDGFAADYQFWLKSATQLKYKFVNEKLIKYRIHEKGTSTCTANREYVTAETIRLKKSARQRYSILDLYPEIGYCKDKEKALAHAYLDFGLGLLTGSFPAPQLAIAEFRRSLEHDPNLVEAVNNIGVCLVMMGQHAEGITWFEREPGNKLPVVQRNLQLAREIMKGQQTQALTLLVPNAATELFSIDPESEEIKRRHKKAAHDTVSTAPNAPQPTYERPPATNNQALRKLLEAARLCKQEGNFAGAIAILEKAKSTVEESGAEHGSAACDQLASIPRPAQENAQSYAQSRVARPTSPQHECMVSVIVPTHNRPDMLVEALRSILNQTYQDFEIIVVNDAGSDVTEIINLLNKDNKITYVKHNRNRGLAAARNTGLKLARGKYIAYLDDDDVFYPQHLKTLVDFLETHPCKAAYTDAYKAIQERQNVSYHTIKRVVVYSVEFNSDFMLVQNYIPVLCVMHERACLDEVGLFDESLEVHEDWDMWIRIGLKYGMRHIKTVSSEFRFRIDGTNSTGDNSIRRSFLETAERIYKKYRAYAEGKPHVLEAQQEHRDTLRQQTNEAEAKLEEQRLVQSSSRTSARATEAEAGKLTVLLYCLEPLLYACPTLRLISPLTSNALKDRVKILAGTTFSSDTGVADVKVDLEPIEHADIIVMQRQTSYATEAVDTIFERARALGKKIIYEIDDNLINMPADHPVAAYFAPLTANIIRDASRADAVTVTTPELAKVFAAYNRNTYVLPNCIDERLWSAEPGQTVKEDSADDRIVIGYMGTQTHDMDFEPVVPAIRNLLRKYRGKVVFRFWGHVPKQLAGVEGVEVIGALDVYYYQFAQVFKTVHFDLALAPLIDNEFNRCKSSVKFLEYAVCRIPGIYSRVTPYATSVADGTTGLLVSNEPAAWEAAMIRLIENRGLRESIAQNAYQEVITKHTVEKNAHRWLRLYSDLLGNTAEAQRSKKVSIIIPVYDKVGYTRQCLQALAANTVYANREVIVVDNGSTDGTKSFLATLGNQIKVLTNQTNLGFAKACNQGARAATGDYLVFLNNDTIPQPGWLEELVKVADADPQVAMVGSKLLFPNDTIQHAGVLLHRKAKLPYHIYRSFPKDHPVVNWVREYPAVTAACVLIKRDIFFAVGGFGEEYFNCYEDIDLCLKIREKGYRIMYTPLSVLYHYESVSEGRKDRDHFVQNAQTFQKKWSDKIPLDEERYYAEDEYKLETDDPYRINPIPAGKIESLLTLARVYKAEGQYHIAIEKLEQAKRLFADLQKCA